MSFKPILALVAALLASPTLARQSAEAELAMALKGRVAGEPVRCISLMRVSGSTIIDRTAILYRVGATLYVNRPRAGSRSLRALDVLETRTFNGELCRGDPVQRRDPSTGAVYGPVLLGDFVPYRRPR